MSRARIEFLINVFLALVFGAAGFSDRIPPLWGEVTLLVAVLVGLRLVWLLADTAAQKLESRFPNSGRVRILAAHRHRAKQTVIAVCALVILLFAPSVHHRYFPSAAPHNYVTNGDFEKRDSSWAFNPRNTNSRAELDGNVRHEGHASMKLVFKADDAKIKAETFGVLGQTIFGLEPQHWYRLRFFAKSDSSAPGAVFVNTDFPWHPKYLPSGAYEWLECVHEFNPGPFNFIQLLFVTQAPAVVWIDDVSIAPAPDPGPGARPLCAPPWPPAARS